MHSTHKGPPHGPWGERLIRGGRIFGVQHEVVGERGGDGVEGGDGDGDGKGEEADIRRASRVEDSSGRGRGSGGNDRRGKRGREEQAQSEDEHVHHCRCVSTSWRQNRKTGERSTGCGRLLRKLSDLDMGRSRPSTHVCARSKTTRRKRRRVRNFLFPVYSNNKSWRLKKRRQVEVLDSLFPVIQVQHVSHASHSSWFEFCAWSRAARGGSATTASGSGVAPHAKSMLDLESNFEKKIGQVPRPSDVNLVNSKRRV